MSKHTNNSRLERTWDPAIAALLPADDLRRQRAVDQAISPDGFVHQRAILPTIDVFEDGMSASHTDTNSSITDSKSYLSGTLVLADGLWRLKFKGGITGRLNSSSNLNATLLVNLIESSNFQVPLASGDTGVVWPRLTIENVPGGSEVGWALMYRPSAGTATAEAGFVDWRAERVG